MGAEAGEDRKFVVFEALNDPTGRVVRELGRREDSAALLVLLDRLAQALPDGPLVVVLDHVAYHKNQMARAWWAEHHARIRPLWLPAYAPELNLIERVWRHVKDKLANHRWWADLAGLQAATATLLDRLEARFQQPVQPGIRAVQNFCEPA